MLVAQPRVSMVLVTALGITTGAQGVRNAQLESMAKIGARAHFAAQEHFKTKPGNQNATQVAARTTLQRALIFQAQCQTK